jgi:hypothetical protein
MLQCGLRGNVNWFRWGIPIKNVDKYLFVDKTMSDS